MGDDSAIRRLHGRLTYWPDRRHWIEALLALGAICATAFVLTRLLPGPTFAAEAIELPLIPVMVAALVIPALAEEVVFRSWLPIRRATEHLSGRWSVLSLAAFIAWHPLQYGLGLPFGRPEFLTTPFLLPAGLLGLACTVSIARSRSLWPAVFIHWAVAIIGKSVF